MPDRLLKLLAHLRHPESGCPWDRKQTPRSLCVTILDEAFELVEAIEQGSNAQVQEELGDLLFQVMFVVGLYAESGQFGLEEVVAGIEAKLTRRHPHVFGNERAETAGQVLTRWEQIKLTEGKQEHPLDSVPKALPALAQTRRLWHKAERLNWLPEKTADASELSRLLVQVTAKTRPEDFADLLFKLAVWGMEHDLDAEELLRAANRQFKEKVKALGNKPGG